MGSLSHMAAVLASSLCHSERIIVFMNFKHSASFVHAGHNHAIVSVWDACTLQSYILLLPVTTYLQHWPTRLILHSHTGMY